MKRKVVVCCCIVVLVLLGGLAYWKGGERGGPDPLVPAPTLRPRVENTVLTCVFLEVLQLQEEAVRLALESREASKERDSGKLDFEIAEQFRQASDRVSAIPTEGVDAAAVALGGALLDNFEFAEKTLRTVAALKLEGGGFGEITRIITTETANEDTHEFSKSTQRELEGRVALGYTSSNGTAVKAGPVSGENKTVASISTSMRGLASAQESVKGRDTATRETKETIVHKLPATSKKDKLLDQLAEIRTRQVAWRACERYVRKVYPDQLDPRNYLVCMRNRREDRHWKECLGYLEKLAVFDTTLDKDDRDEMQLTRILCHYQLGDLKLANKGLDSLRRTRGFGTSRDLMALNARVQLALGLIDEARQGFQDCLKQGQLADNDRFRLWLGQHEREAEIGLIACKAATGQRDQARQDLEDLLRQNRESTGESDLYTHLRPAVSGHPDRKIPGDSDKKSLRDFENLLKLEVAFEAWPDWKYDDFYVTNRSAFPITDVKLTVTAERKDGTVDPREETWNLIGRDEKVFFEKWNLLTAETVTIRFKLTCRQGQSTALHHMPQ